jgi:hypothetical protein
MALRGALWRKIKEKNNSNNTTQFENNYVELQKKPEKPITNRRWEYRVVVLNHSDRKEIKASESWTKVLCELGKEGWEMVGIIPMVAQLGFFGMPPHIRCFFKREVR